MKTINKIMLIGAGGSGSMVIPAIIPTYHVDVWDGDKYEKRNSSRQIAALGNVDKFKSDVMVTRYGGGEQTLTSYPTMVRGDERTDADLVFCCVDNNDARLAAKTIANTHDIPLIVCGNETWDPMAWLYEPMYEHSNKDCFVRWDLGNLTEGRQETCEGVAIIQENEQMPAANMAAATHGLHILESLRICESPEHYLAEVYSTPWPEYRQMKNIPLNNEK